MVNVNCHDIYLLMIVSGFYFKG